MRRPLFLIMFLLLCIYAKAQENESALPKGLLLENPVRPIFNGYTTEATIVEVANQEDLNSWTRKNFILTSTPVELVTTGSYANQASYTLESPIIQLPVLDSEQKRLNLYLEEKFSLESYHDEALIQISLDNGENWTTLSARSGEGPLRTSVINLTAYSGKEVRLAFRLDTDESYTYDGWTIKSIQIRQDVLIRRAQLSANKKVGVQNYSVMNADPLNGNLSSLDAQRFPRFVFANVSVNEGNVPISSLEEANFSLVETIKDSVDDVRTVVKDETFKVYAPDSIEISRPVDIVFLMDNSGSMGDEQAQVAANVESFVNKLDSLGFDYRLALCRFGQSTNSGKPIFHNNAGWYTNGAAFVDVWNAVNTVNGAIEPSWDALYYASQQYSFAPAAQKIFILITDESITGNNIIYSEITDRQLVIDQLQAVGVQTYTLVPNNAPFDSDFGVIADATGGQSYNILSPFNDILEDIGGQIGNTYTIRYTPTKPIFDGFKREVEITVDYNSKSLTLNGEYTPGKAPIVLRTDTTLALHRKAQLSGNPVLIEVGVRDEIAPYPVDVSLYYRIVNPDTPNVYIQIPMTQNGGNSKTSFWSAEIPGNNVLDPGIEYYIRASDGEATTTAPEFIDKEGYPWSFAVLPNLPPSVVNMTMTNTLKVGDTIHFRAEAIDYTNYVENVWVYVRRPDDINYQPYKMQPIGSDMYEYSGLVIRQGLTEYFIVAEDDYGVDAFDGDEINPYIIATDVPWEVNTNATERHTINLAGFDFSTFTQWSVEAKLGSENLAIGDYIGVFFKDCDGGVCVEKCGGFDMWKGQPNGFASFTIYGDDAATIEKDGFEEGDALIFKVFSKKDNRTYDAEHTLLPSSQNYTFKANGATNVGTIHAYYEQQIAVKKNLNLWSTYLEPRDKSFDAIFADYSGEVREVIDNEGKHWQPGGASNTLTMYEPGYGYEVYMHNTGQVIKVKGNKLDVARVQVHLVGNQQRTLVGAPYAEAENVEAAFSNHVTNVYAVDRYINDGTGFITIETYSPMFSINNWTDKNMNPGEAYFIFALNPDPAFTFPQPSGAYSPSSTASRKIAASLARFGDEGGNSSNKGQTVRSIKKYMNVILPTTAWGAQQVENGELRAYNGNTLIGKTPIIATGNALILDGFELEEGAVVELRFWSPSTNKEYPLAVNSWLAGNGQYANHTVAIAESVEVLDIPIENDGLTIYPNPARDQLKVLFVSEDDTEIGISLISLQGQTVQSLQSEGGVGTSLNVLNISGLKKGMYFLKITQGKTVKVRQVLVE